MKEFLIAIVVIGFCLEGNSLFAQKVIKEIIMDKNSLYKYDSSNGDTFDPFWTKKEGWWGT